MAKTLETRIGQSISSHSLETISRENQFESQTNSQIGYQEDVIGMFERVMLEIEIDLIRNRLKKGKEFAAKARQKKG